MRFFNISQQQYFARQISRTNSNESFVPEIHQILEALEDEDILEEFPSEGGDFPDSKAFLMMTESYISDDLFSLSLKFDNKSSTPKTFLQKNDYKTDRFNESGSINSLNLSTAKLRASFFFDKKFSKRSNLTLSRASPIFTKKNLFDNTQLYNLSNTAPATPTKWKNSKKLFITKSQDFFDNNNHCSLFENLDDNKESKKNLQLSKLEKNKTFPAYFNYPLPNVSAASSLAAWRVFNSNKIRRLKQPTYRRFINIKLLLCSNKFFLLTKR